MKNYIEIDGRKIKLSKETIDNIKEAFEEESFEEDKINYASFVDNPEKRDFTTQVFRGDLRVDCQIGFRAAPDKLMGRCLILSKDYNWSIIDNYPDVSSNFTKLLVAERKKS